MATGFYPNPNVKDGFLNWCRVCASERYRAGRSERQKDLLAYVQQIKIQRGCVDCGYNAHPAALDFDHLPGFEKTNRVSTMAAGSTKAKIDAEIAKCEVVCANCHRVRTAERRNETT
jgi:hypothetical protein